MNGRLILYAPNVHTGGGYVLLRSLLAAWPAGSAMVAFLDQRARQQLVPPVGAQANWVHASAGSRLGAEWQLHRESTAGDTVLCFHGLPPILPNAARVVVFQQNRNYLGLNPLSDFAARTALRLAFERFVSRVFSHRVCEYIVQTPTMARDLQRWLTTLRGKPKASLRVLPFADEMPPAAATEKEWDFVYVADGVGHKNHGRLLAAWGLLAEQGLHPSLALTLGPRDAKLIHEVEAFAKIHGVRVHNLGLMRRDQVLELYARSKAMIFPSTSESFGLPLIEASRAKLPIVAAEADYVRDVCTPIETFDPLSPVSIARAVRRFMGQPQAPFEIHQPQDLWAALREGRVGQ